MRFSFSRIETFERCPFKFKLHYIDGLDTLPNFDDADNPLTIGTAMHHAIEEGAEKAIAEYLMSYPVVTDAIETEAVKIEVLAPKVRSMIDLDALFEFKIDTKLFLGFVDYLDTKTGTLLDFKYSNNVKHYLESPQIHLYRFLLEKVYGMKIERQGYLFIPKVKTPEKLDSIQMTREALRSELEKAQPEIKYVIYDENRAVRTLSQMYRIWNTVEFPKNENRLCWWCEYRQYCNSNGKEDYMILPKNERRVASATTQRKLWIYGPPFSGKTTLANSFPDVLMLNTDGNTKYIDAPVVKIAELVEVDGHITRKTPAWQVFKDTIDELAKKQNTFESIVVDLIEDVYEACRLYMYDSLGIKHESDNPYKAWDIIRTEFLSTIKRLMNLDYQNIILISHEDMSKDITKRTGDSITAIKPNIQDKIANKLAGMVDVVIRCVVIDDDHILSFKSDEAQFGGGRMKINAKTIPNSYAELCKVYEMGASATPKVETPVEELPDTPKVEEPVRKSRRTRTEELPAQEEVGIEEVIPVEDEAPKTEQVTESPVETTRRRRRRS